MREEERFLQQAHSEEGPVQNRVDFLRKIIPFHALKEEEVKEIAMTMGTERFDPGEVIIKQGVQGAHFYLTVSGLVKVYLLDEEGKETVLGFLGEGDCFGEIALLTQGPTTSCVQAVEETFCFVQEREAFLSMTQTFPVFHKFFNQLLTQRMRAVYRELLSESPGVAQVEPFLYRKQVGEIVSPLASLTSPQGSIEEAARKMTEKNLDALVVVDDQKRPKGILRLSRIVKAVLVEGIDPREPVETIMETTFSSIDHQSYFFDALHEMIKQRTNELIVLDGERIEGILTGLDLLRFRGREVLSLLRNIEEAPDISRLNRMRGEVEKVLKALMADGAFASHACKIVSEFNDKMVRRVVKLAEEECGCPPCPYAWLGLGSEGRKEQTLLTDQDNAILFSDSSKEEPRRYFRRFSEKVVEGLDRCGFPLCKGGVMATHPKWFGGLEEWRARMAGWITQPGLAGEENLSDIYTFLDFRSICGEASLERQLKSSLFELIRENPSFLRSLAQNIVSIPVPLGFFKNFIVEKSGKHKNRLNLKMNGLVPLITCVKLLAFKKEIPETNTLERIRGLGREMMISKDQEEILEQGFETFLTLKIRNNLADIEQGRELSNHIDPAELSTRQKQLLKESFGAVSQLQKITRGILRVEDQFGGLR